MLGMETYELARHARASRWTLRGPVTVGPGPCTVTPESRDERELVEVLVAGGAAWPAESDGEGAEPDDDPEES